VLDHGTRDGRAQLDRRVIDPPTLTSVVAATDYAESDCSPAWFFASPFVTS
jgi:hypothetical protein